MIEPMDISDDDLAKVVGGSGGSSPYVTFTPVPLTTVFSEQVLASAIISQSDIRAKMDALKQKGGL